MEKNENNNFIFPALDHLIINEEIEFQDDVIAREHDEKINGLLRELEEKNKEIEKLQSSLNELTENSQVQLKAFNEFTKRLEASLPMVNDNHISAITNIIKLLAIKIIHKEIDKDDAVIKKMLADFLEQTGQEGLLTVEVSSKDFNVLSQASLPKNIKLSMREELAPGDIIVISQDHVCIKRINELLDLVMSQHYE